MTARTAEPAVDPYANGVCPFGEGTAPGAGCILPAGHEPANRHVVTAGDDLDDED
ncbi:hypothetical protein ACFVIY_37870 [Streptomyces sp. NPDC127166]|uniref:hypothetical protein n=1 Tax=Streptomyces sp. NPDC127166 TaxID=3345380 RepID=UPI0036411417